MQFFIVYIFIYCCRIIRQLTTFFKFIKQLFFASNVIEDIILIPSDKHIAISKNNINPIKLFDLCLQVDKKTRAIIVKFNSYHGETYVIIKHKKVKDKEPCDLIFNDYNLRKTVLFLDLPDYFSRNDYLNNILKRFCSEQIVIDGSQCYWSDEIDIKDVEYVCGKIISYEDFIQ